MSCVWIPNGAATLRYQWFFQGSSIASATASSLPFPTARGCPYAIDYKTNLADAAWIALSTNAGSGSILTNRYPIDFSPSRFFRVRVP